jgi:hypothetical protein
LVIKTSLYYDARSEKHQKTLFCLEADVAQSMEKEEEEEKENNQR